MELMSDCFSTELARLLPDSSGTEYVTVLAPKKLSRTCGHIVIPAVLRCFGASSSGHFHEADQDSYAKTIVSLTQQQKRCPLFRWHNIFHHPVCEAEFGVSR